MNKQNKEVSFQFAQKMLFDEWSNSACCGYLISACKSLKYTNKEICTIIKSLNNAFNNISVDDAKKIYENY